LAFLYITLNAFIFASFDSKVALITFVAHTLAVAALAVRNRFTAGFAGVGQLSEGQVESIGTRFATVSGTATIHPCAKARGEHRIGGAAF
jgi:hypothetical protein